MTIALVLGVGFGIGIWLLVRGLQPTTPGVGDALTALREPRWLEQAASADDSHWLDRRARGVSVTLLEASGADLGELRRDLAVTGLTLETHALDKFKMSLVFGGLPILMWVVMTAGGVVINPFVMVIAVVAFAGGGFYYQDIELTRKANDRRRAFRTSLLTYLDLVVVLLAGGAGVESALETAADQGRGWGFTLIRRSLNEARYSGRSPWQALYDTASSHGLAELVELSATMQLAGESGARIRSSLQAKAESLRAHELAEIEEEAARSTENMAGPVGAMVLGFVILIGYPAIDQILSL